MSPKHDEKWVDMLTSGKLMGVRLKHRGSTLISASEKLQDSVADWIEAVEHFFDVRFTRDAHQVISTLSKCMDLRIYCRANFGRGRALSQFLQQEVRTAFYDSWQWASDAGIDVAERIVVWRELCLLAERLYTDVYNFYRGAEGASVYKWHDNKRIVNVSGTEIQKQVLTDRKLYVGCENVLHFYQMCALKSMNEAVVEGMCKVVDQHAGGNRGLSLERYAYESILHYNMPAQNHCTDFIKSSLKRYAKKYNKCGILRFYSTDKKQRALKSYLSKTVDRLMASSSRLSFM